MKHRVKVLLEMPGDQFDLLIAKCAETDRVYTILRNGLITPYGENKGSSRAAVILCDQAEAKLVIDFAKSLGDEIARNIRQYPANE